VWDKLDSPLLLFGEDVVCYGRAKAVFLDRFLFLSAASPLRGQKKLLRLIMPQPVSILPVSARSLTWPCLTLIAACFFCLISSLAVAADSEVEMPPMPGQVYHAPGKPVTEGEQTDLPSELKQLDEQIQHDAAALAGDRPVGNEKAAKSQADKGAPAVDQGAAAHAQTTKGDRGSAGMSPVVPIVLVAAVGALAVFILRRRGRSGGK